MLIEEKRRVAADERIRLGLAKSRREAIEYVFDFPESQLDEIVKTHREWLQIELFKCGLFVPEFGTGKTKREVIKEKIAEVKSFSPAGVTIFLGDNLDEIL